MYVCMASAEPWDLPGIFSPCQKVAVRSCAHAISWVMHDFPIIYDRYNHKSCLAPTIETISFFIHICKNNKLIKVIVALPFFDWVLATWLHADVEFVQLIIYILFRSSSRRRNEKRDIYMSKSEGKKYSAYGFEKKCLL
ncbi:hypothetical protein ACJX0J_024055 [Zea mays]